MARHYYPLSHPQKRIWYTEKFYPEDSVSNIAFTTFLPNSVDFTLLEQAIQAVVRDNQGLCLQLAEFDNGKEVEVQQYVAACDIEKVDFFDFSGRNSDNRLEEWARKITKQPFVLLNSPLFYVAMLQLEEAAGFYFKIHHIIGDGWTAGLLTNQVCEYYSCLKAGKKLTEEPKPSYLEFLRREKNYLKSPQLVKDRQYWQEKFKTIPPQVRLSLDAVAASPAAARKVIAVPPELRKQLLSFCQQQQTTVYRLFLSCLYIYIARITGENDIVIGVPHHNRAGDSERATAGMFTSSVPLRTAVDAKLPFGDFCRAVDEELQFILSNHQQYPYDLLMLDLRQQHSFVPDFLDIVLVQFGMNNTAQQSFWHFKESLPNSLSIFINPYAKNIEEQLELAFDYRVEAFSEEDITRLIERFLCLLANAIGNPSQKIGQVEIIPPQERRRLLLGFNDTTREYPRDKTIQQLFAEQVERTPEKAAVVYNNVALTYAKLNEKADQVAYCLRQKGVGRNTIVGILIERSLEMIVGLLGILKAGGAYMPIDPEYPKERMEYMLKDSETGFLLTRPQLAAGLDFCGQIIDIAQCSEYAAIEPVNMVNDLAYVLYTSGSTGRPKGVLIEHKSVVNFIAGVKAVLDFSGNKTILCLTTIAFDIFVTETLAPLASGLRILLAGEQEQQHPKALEQLIMANQVDIVQMTPSRLLLFKNSDCLQALSKVSQLIAGGEPFPPVLLDSLVCLPTTKIFNLYAPTETTIYSTAAQLFPGQRVTIGRPIANTAVYIVDNELRLQPMGVVGEICIGGVGLARGYLNQAELTEQKFIPNPFKPGERVYRTGDLARWLPSGEIECLGRSDHQVKIRGYRIELGEIETALAKYPGIKEAAVMARRDEADDQYIAAYYTAVQKIETGELAGFLGKTLPRYMLPSFFMPLPQMPLTNNGKINRLALPEPKTELLPSKQQQPGTATEKLLAALWQEVLGFSNIGLDDDFFALGGHSIKAMKLLVKLQQRIKQQISLQELFRLPTIRKLAEFLAARGQSSGTEILPAPCQNTYPLSFAQQRIYFLTVLAKRDIYTISWAMRIKGNLDRENFQLAWNRLVERHEALRTVFCFEQGELRQKIMESLNISVAYYEAEPVTVDVQTFSLETAPLLAVKLVKSCDEYVCLCSLHHIIADGLSLDLCRRDLWQLYDEICLYGKAQLPLLTLQYKDYAVWQKNRVNSQGWEKAQDYWQSIFADEVSLLDLPNDYARPLINTFAGKNVKVAVAPELAERLSGLAQENGTTLFMLLLAAYNILLAKYSGQEEIIVGSAANERSSAELLHVVGMFANTLALKNYPLGDKTFRQFLGEVQANTLAAFEHQDYPFDELVKHLNLAGETSGNPLFNVMFLLETKEEAFRTASGLEVAPYQISEASDVARFDITLTALAEPGRLSFVFNYYAAIFKQQTIEGLARSFITLLQQITANENRLISEYSLLTPIEGQLLAKFNATARLFPQVSVQELFENQVRLYPEAIAVKCQDEQLTYEELNRKANKLAEILWQRGVRADDIVGVMLPRSPKLLAGLMGILKAGGAYLPIDPAYPPERIQYMLSDSGARILLVDQASLLVSGSGFSGQVINIDDLTEGSEANPVNKSQSSHLAYVIYTSGSTGLPKGVMIEHSAVVNFILGMAEKIDFAPPKTVLALTTVSFDIFVLETLLPLCQGLTVLLANEAEQMDMEVLSRLLLTNKIDIMQMTPSRLRMFYEIGQMPLLGKADTLLIGGEPFPDNLLPVLNSLKCKVYNVYGPTETTVWSTVKKVTDTSSVTIGQPIANTKIYIVDKYYSLQPVGVIGELCIGGLGLARGYLNRAELTSEKFIPLSGLEERIYKTGDLAKWLPNGEIICLGRVDNQIKLRGFRIELGEIENRLAKYPQLEKAVVAALTDDNESQALCAYYTARESLTAAKLRDYLKAVLPEYMVPHYFVQLEKIPLTPNGKINRKALPKPLPNRQNDTQFEAPRTSLEKVIADIWQQILGVSAISIYDNFFEIGGDSIKAVRITALMQKAALTLSIADFFLNPTIAGQAGIFTDSTLYKEAIVSVLGQTSATLDSAETNILWVPHAKEEMPNCRFRVFCLPYAGASAGVYRALGDFLPPDIELCLVELPGRGRRFAESLHYEFDALVKGLYADIKPYLTQPYGIFGHSLGGLLAYQLAETIAEEGQPYPRHLFVSGTAAPHEIKEVSLSGLADAAFKETLFAMGGIPEEIYKNEAWWNASLPIFRADYRVLETYAKRKKSPLSCGITVLNGRSDPAAKASGQWREYCQQGFAEALFAGGHFYLNDYSEQIAALITHTLKKEG